MEKLCQKKQYDRGIAIECEKRKKRPTCVTAIGWTWIVLGALFVLAAAGDIMARQILSEWTQNKQDVQGVFEFRPLHTIVAVGVSLLTITSGINFLRLRRWSRHVLEVMTWLMLLYVVCSGVFFLIAEGQDPFDIFYAVTIIITTSVQGILLIIMLKYLRGSKVKNAMIISAEAGSATNRSKPELNPQNPV